MSHISGQVSSGCLTLLVSAKVWEVLFQFDEFLAEVCAFTLFKGVPFTFFDGICVRFCPRRGSRKRFRRDPPGFCAGTGISNGARGLGASGFRSRFTMESAPVRL